MLVYVNKPALKSVILMLVAREKKQEVTKEYID